jgi:hypothetical protein
MGYADRTRTAGCSGLGAIRSWTSTCAQAPAERCRHVLQAIWRGNVLDFVSYGFYCSTFEGLDLQRQAATLAFVAEAERLWGVRCAQDFGM